MAVFQQMLIFTLLVMAGLYARHKRLVTDESQAQISGIVVRIAYPAIILSGAITDEPHVTGTELLFTFGVTLALLIFLLAGAWILPRILRYEKKYYTVVNLMTMFSSIGFMGVPMIDALYGKGALIYLTVFLIPFTLLFYSYAMTAIKGGAGSGFRLRDVLNEGMLACFLAVPLYLANVQVPCALQATLHMLGAMTAPLAMLLMGALLADMDWRGMFSDVRIWAFSLVKMIILPAAVVLALGRFVDSPVLLGVCMAAIATPVGNGLALLAAMYNKEAYPVSMKGITLTTLVAPITMPIAYWLAGLA